MGTTPAVGGAGILTRLFGTAVSGAAGFAAGTALGPTLSPIVRLIANDVNAHFPYVPPNAGTLAQGVAQGQVDETQAREWAAMHGIGKPAFTALVNIANTGPGSAYAFELWRRGLIKEPGFKRALKRIGIEQEWIDDLAKTHDVLLNVSDVANAVQQGHMPNDGILPPPVTGTLPLSIPLTQIPLKPIDEAAGHGVTEDRLKIITNLVGLPPGDIELLQMLNRGIVDEASVDAGIREGHRKTKWIPAVKELRWAILSPIQYVEAHLRGWIKLDEMHKGGLKSGMRPAEMDLLFKIHGRPISFHQVWIGLQRGGTYDGPTTGIAPAFLDSLRQSNIKPEYYNLAWAQRYTYPSAFVMRALVQTGVLTQAQGEADLIDMGWRPDRAKQVSTAWASGTAAKGDTHAVKAQTQLWSTLHRSYLAGESTAPEVTAALPRAGVSTAAVADVLATWDEERTIIRKQLSPAQVKKAYVEGVLNPDTGQAWTKDEATAALVARGYSTADATTFLEL